MLDFNGLKLKLDRQKKFKVFQTQH